MDKEKLIEITKDVENKSNNDLKNVLSELEIEFENTKELVVNLTRHLDTLTEIYSKVSKELDKRKKK